MEIYKVKRCGFLHNIRLKVGFLMLLCGMIMSYIVLSVILYGKKQFDTPIAGPVKPPHTQCRANSITVNFGGRIGNFMFQYASLFGIAKNYSLVPFISKDNLLRRIFSINCTSAKKSMIGMHMNHFEEHASAYDARVEILEPGFSYLLNGYYQSWKYFSHIENDIRRHFTFQENVQNDAVNYLNSVKRSFKVGSNESTFIGVHVRRGDVANNLLYRYKGFVAVEPEYILSAMKRMREEFKNVLFIVCSDDIDWCKKNIKHNDVFFSNAKSPSVDLAILSNCNHSIITTGSFGWWGAWLAHGLTIYYKKWPRANSILFEEVNHKDYFPPSWIPM